MLKIVEYEIEPKIICIELEGKLISRWVIELEKLIEKYLAQKKKLLLDCSKIHFVDEKGIEVLTKYSSEYVEKINCSLLIKMALGFKE